MKKRKSPEEIRAERIANLQDPEARAAINKIQKERAGRLLEIAAKQKLSHDQRVAIRCGREQLPVTTCS